MSLPPRAASLRGDDFQHTYAWSCALRVLLEDDVESVSVEDPSGGAFDDIVLRSASGAHEYWQAKSSNYGGSVIDDDWLMTRSSPGGKSPLQHFYETWLRLKSVGEVRAYLVTNRAFDRNSPILAERDLLTEKVDRGRLLTGGPRSALGKARGQWAEHLGVSQDVLADFVCDLHFRSTSEVEVREKIQPMMRALGLRHDDAAVTTGVSMVTEWVKRGAGPRTRPDIQLEVGDAGLLAEADSLVFTVHGVDRYSGPEAANASLDLLDLYEGDDPRSRFRISEDWDAVVKKRLQASVRELENFGVKRVRVVGHMRLPMWFAVGHALPDVRGWVLETEQRGDRWSSEGADLSAQVASSRHATSTRGSGLGVAISLTHDISEAVATFVETQPLDVGSLLNLSVPAGASQGSIPDGAFAAGWARNARDEIRRVVRETGSTSVHLFFAAPAGEALMLGHAWNLLPSATVYEFDQATLQYFATFTL